MGKLFKKTNKKTKNPTKTRKLKQNNTKKKKTPQKNTPNKKKKKKLAIQYAFSDKMHFSLDILAKQEMFL